MKWPMGDPRRDDPLPPKHHISVIDLIRENPRYAGYYKFAVVREPLDRLRSAYTDFLTDSGRSNYHMSLREYDNFEHFCQELHFDSMAARTLILGHNMKWYVTQMVILL